MKNKFVLDCTLRDGGYVNNWGFNTATARGIINGIYDSGIRNIELGIMGKGGQAGKQTKFSNFKSIEPLLEERKADCLYYVMLNQAEQDYFAVPERSANTPDCIRLAFFKENWQEALDFASELMSKGYMVFLQAMATFLYSDEELKKLTEAVNKLCPNAFYMVDSFGTMYNDDVQKMTKSVCKFLDHNILLGFHAHNNVQMAFSNTISFLGQNCANNLITDCSIFGMGRGAGNVPTELLLHFFNTHVGTKYDINSILFTFDRYLRTIFKTDSWGYSMEYFLTASKKMNSAYGWYLNAKKITDLIQINGILDEIPQEICYSLSKDAVNALLQVKQEKLS